MAIITANGIFDEQNQRITSPHTGTWNDLGVGDDSAGANLITTWDEWTSWTFEPAATLNHLTEITDLGENAYFNVTWTGNIVGTPTFYVYTSTTGAFAGEETTTTVNVDDTDIEAFYGRYVMIGISVALDPAAGPSEIIAFDFTCSGNRFDIQQFDINSADLSGSSSARQIAMPRTVSKVLSVVMTAQADQYVESSYVASDYIEDGVPGFPITVTKTRTAPTVTFVNTSGNRVDATFDIRLTVLPEQYMDGANMLVR
jgi:hypothetical protein